MCSGFSPITRCLDYTTFHQTFFKDFNGRPTYYGRFIASIPERRAHNSLCASVLGSLYGSFDFKIKLASVLSTKIQVENFHGFHRYESIFSIPITRESRRVYSMSWVLFLTV